ncbi:putative non-specific serine/threonine protein kinase [Helianthus anomalus]
MNPQLLVTTGNESEPSTCVHCSQLCRHFKFHEIQSATRNFDESIVIGQGGFGRVVAGRGNGQGGFGRVVVVVVKRKREKQEVQL